MMIPMNNNTPRICKICHRRFSSGKAMGGHMRSHLAKANPKPNPNFNPYTNKPDPDSFSSSSYSYPQVHNNRHHHDVTRSKHYSLVESSSYRDHILSVEETALILMKMSTDSWTRTTQSRVPRMVNDMDSDEDENGESYGVRARSITTAEIGKYKCLNCHKRFTSYQALGGHMASHKKMKGVVIQEEEEDEEDDEDVGYNNYGNASEEEGLGFKCSYCDKVLKSSEALEVHKKIHYYYDLENVNSTRTTTNDSLDLNRPAEDDNDYYYQFGSSKYGVDS